VELIDNKYYFGNISVLDLCEKYGTPLFVYDAEKIKKQYQKLTRALSVEKYKIHYACKALTNLTILKLMKSLGAGIDAVSIGEIQMAIQAGFEPKEIIFTPNSVSHEELEEAIRIGVMINIDNIDTLEYLGLNNHNNLPIFIRINPHIMAGGNSNISVGHIDSKFGISIYQLPLVERLVQTLSLNVRGIHMHTGSDILDVEVFLEAADILFESAERFPNIEYIDFGSGFKVKYKLSDNETDIVEFGKAISDKFNDYCAKTGKDLTLLFEPGKFLVSEAGFFFVKTNVIKHTPAAVFACVDSGFNHIIRPMFYNAHHEIINISYPQGKPKLYTVTGYICETDTFGWNRRINEVNAGDVLCFFNAGAYCYSMSSNYNSRVRPAEVMIYEGKDYLISRKETFEDLIKTQVDPGLF